MAVVVVVARAEVQLVHARPATDVQCPHSVDSTQVSFAPRRFDHASAGGSASLGVRLEDSELEGIKSSRARCQRSCRTGQRVKRRRQSVPQVATP